MTAQPKTQEEKEALFKDPEFQKKWEKKFGKDAGHRTAQQWSALVQLYGIGAVARLERMSLPEVHKKCESKSQIFDRKMREKRLRNDGDNL